MLEVESAALSLLRALTRQWSPTAPIDGDPLLKEAELGLMQHALAETKFTITVSAPDERLILKGTASGRISNDLFMEKAREFSPHHWFKAPDRPGPRLQIVTELDEIRRTHLGDQAIAACEAGQSLIEFMVRIGSGKPRIFVTSQTLEPVTTDLALSPASAPEASSELISVASQCQAPPAITHRELPLPANSSPTPDPIEAHEGLRLKYQDPDNYWRNVWLYELKKASTTNEAILDELGKRATEFAPIESANALRAAIKTIAQFHNWPLLKGKSGRPKA